MGKKKKETAHITRKNCGCFVSAIVNSPSDFVANYVAVWKQRGLEVEEVDEDYLQNYGKCPHNLIPFYDSSVCSECVHNR